MRRLLHAVVVEAVLSFAPTAQAEPGFAVARYEPAERGAGWLVVDALDFRARPRPTVGATIDYAYKPLVVYDDHGEERSALVRHQLLTHLGASFVLAERVRVGASLPLALYQDGESAFVGGRTLSPATKSALGDLRLAADVRLLGAVHFTSDGVARLGPQVLASGELGVFAWAARAAFVYRPGAERYAGTSLEGEVLVAAGAGLRLGGWVVGPEVFATTALDRVFGAGETPLDAILGGRHRLGSDLVLAAAIGSGLTRGYGSPAFRALLALESASPIAEAPGDRDRDGIVDPVDACPDWPGVRSEDLEANGCPAPERIPDEDTDGDAIWDRDDACPAVPGVRSGDPMINGCPRGTARPLAVVTETEIRIAEQIRFATASSALVESDVILEAVRRLLEEHAEIKKVRVEGHTDDVGDPSFNEELSAHRAASVATWLTDHGIGAARLETEGYGSRHPLDPIRTEEARAKNRRVVFTIVERRGGSERGR